MKLEDLRRALAVTEVSGVEEPPPFRGTVIPKQNLERVEDCGKESISFAYAARILSEGSLIAVGDYVYKVAYRSHSRLHTTYTARRLPEYDPR